MSTTPKQEKILVIEGETAFGSRVVDALKKEGYIASLAVDGATGLKLLYDTLPHLVLVDVVLPGMDGYQILAKKQGEPLLAKIPVFLLSTQGVPINMARVPQGAVREFILDLHADPIEIVKRANTLFGYPLPGGDVPDAGGTKKKLLWVEDDKLIGNILAKKLIASGFDLYHAKNGQEALQYLADHVPDVMVFDLLMPGMTGFDILQKAKADPRLKTVPTMILSNLNKQTDIERAKVLGAQKFLVKAAASLDQIVEEIRGLTK